MAFPHREEVLVQSFFNYFDFDGESLDEVAELPVPEQRRRFGGTLAPTVRLSVDGDRSRVRGTLDHWHLPTADEPLPAPDDRGRAAGDPTLVDRSPSREGTSTYPFPPSGARGSDRCG